MIAVTLLVDVRAPLQQHKSVFNIDTDAILANITLLLGDTSPLGTHKWRAKAIFRGALSMDQLIPKQQGLQDCDRGLDS